MFDRDDLPTRPYAALAPEPTQLAIRLPDGPVDCNDTLEEATPVPSGLSTTLTIPAERAYQLFCDSERVPEWMAVVRSSRIVERTTDGRAQRTAFIARLERASVGYTLAYTYDDDALTLLWSTAKDASMFVAGRARFLALGPRACMMHYELELRSNTSLPAWGDAMYEGHPASSVLSDFREFVGRNR